MITGQNSNKNSKNLQYPHISENVQGMFYVDIRCIGCSVCAEIAPAHFASNHDEGHEYIYSQPVTDAEIALCNEAMEICPVNAIGKIDNYR
ncbi:MAG: ferredoxin [Desulfamplus sp.]|nr:ferredoxin [Desulfamplus sp.]MBF0412624.1 ferredoxin [Desulfamplus sp.]